MPSKKQPVGYPYIANSVPHIKEQMLREVGAESISELYEEIPERLRLHRKMDLPQPLLSEYALRQHVEGLLARNTSTHEVLSFLGAGCYQHYVPAVCDEVNSRNEFLTAYSGRAYEDHGRFQALWEFESLMGELLEFDVVSLPTYDSYQAAATCLRMSSRVTNRSQLVLCHPLDPGKLSKILDYCRPSLEITVVKWEAETGQVDLDALEAAVSSQTAAVYFDNPNFLGAIETKGDQIAELAHQHGALVVVGADPISLGVLASPATYGADYVCGEIQPLGMHMSYGGGHAGYMATRDEEKLVQEFPTRLVGIAPTVVPGEYGFGEVAFERTSFMKREGGKEYLGTMSNLWAITAGVYLALMGPKGMVEIGQAIMARAKHAMQQINTIGGVKAPYFPSTPFQEFVVNFDATRKSVVEINQALLAQGIFGGLDLSRSFPELGQSALYCVSEIHTQADIERLVGALKGIVQS
jgi:glycine dehydrogenase subunit 1